MFSKTPEAIQTTPLAKRKDTGATKAFTLLDDEAIGVHFKGKRLTKEKLEALNYSSALTQMDAAHGVCAGDYDGDGDLDLFVTNFSHDNNTLYENNGRGFFTDVSFNSALGKESITYLG